MKQCKGCRFADWHKTQAGKLHPSGSGWCRFVYVPAPLPASMYWAGVNGHKPYGGHIDRHDEDTKPCVVREPGEYKKPDEVSA